MNYNVNALYHHGVKGMKWGIRRDRKTSAKLREYRNSRKTDPKTDVLGMNRPNSAARSYYRAQRTKNFQTYRKQAAIMDRKIAGLSKSQIENGRYRVARARNIRSKTISGLLAGGSAIGLAAAGAAPAAPIAAGIVAVGANYLTGGHYYQQQSATYGSRRASREARSRG